MIKHLTFLSYFLIIFEFCFCTTCLKDLHQENHKTYCYRLLNGPMRLVFNR